MSEQLSISHLGDILSVLTDFRNDRWEDFGLKAGLYDTTLSDIAADCRSSGVKTCFKECLRAWLRMEDKVKDKGIPTWLGLAEIMEELGDKAIADNIRRNKGSTSNGSSSGERSCQRVPSASSAMESNPIPIHGVDLENEYSAMNGLLSVLLRHIADEIFKNESLEVIKMYLAGIIKNNNERISEIKEVNDRVDLVNLLRHQYSLSNVIRLRYLAQNCKCETEHIMTELDELVERRDEFYGKILAKDFAKKAIKDHEKGNTESTITFKVLWDMEEATLKEFEEFLKRAFYTNEIFIKLRVVTQSHLTFVCTIPNWLVEEMTDYVTKNKDFIISQGVFEVTINDSLIFNVKEKGYAALSFYEPNGMLFFTAAPSKKLNDLLKFISEHHQFAEVGPIYFYNFKLSHGFIELKFDETLPTGWSIIPTVKPCKLYQDNIDKFDGTSLPSFCMISIHGLPDSTTEPVLHYPVPLEGVLDPATLFIHKVLQSTIPMAPTTPYTGLVYYELKKDSAFTITFTAAKNVKALVKYIETHYPLAKITQLVHFDFNSSHDHIELNFDFHQESPSTGWSIKPHVQPCKIYKNDIDSFDEAVLPSFCVVSVYGLPNAVPTLNYTVPLVGVTDPVTLHYTATSKPTATWSQDDMSYTGLVYYEWKGKEYLMTFTAAKKLSKLLEFIEEYHPLAEVDQIINFAFSSPHGYIDLIFDHPEDDDSCKGWTIQPLVRPCRLYKEDICNFGETNYLSPPSCLVSVYGSPNAVPTLNYSVPLVGVADPVNIVVNRKLQLEKNYIELFDKFHSLQIENEALKEEKHEKDVEVAASMEKMYESLEKVLTMAKEKQEVSEKILALMNRQKRIKQLESFKLFNYDMSKLEVILQPMENIWYQLGHHLNVEVSLLSEIEQTKDAKEQMRSLLQLCSDRGVTMMQLKEALVELDQKHFIHSLTSFEFSTVELEDEPENQNKVTDDDTNNDRQSLEKQITTASEAEEKKEIVSEYEKIKVKVDDNEVFMIKVLEKMSQALEQLYEEKQIITEENEKLKAKVTDNEEYTAKLMKGKTQLQERSPFAQKQSIKETRSIGLQFDYLIPSMDNLECLSDVQVAGKKLFLVQGDKPQLMNWERFGLRIGIEEDSLSSFETVEVAAAALVGGEFKFPRNTVLVSAVYAVTVSRDLLKPLRLEMQHCVDLTGRPGLSQYLKFAIAPVSTPSLPYQFRIIEGGEFSSVSRYGSIQRKQFCLVCILGEKEDTHLEEEEAHLQEEKEDSEQEKTESEIEDETDEEEDSVRKVTGLPLFRNPMIPTTQSPFSILKTSIRSAMMYAGWIFYERKDVEDLVIFTAAKDLNALLQFIERKHIDSGRTQNVYFSLKDPGGYIELKLDAPQRRVFTGWTIEPHVKPCRIHRREIDDFGENSYHIPPSCFISVYGQPNAEPTLHYDVPLVGVTDPVTLYIHRSLRSPPHTPLLPSLSAKTLPSAGMSDPIGVKVKKVVNDVLDSHFTALTSLKTSLSDLAAQLFAVGLISDEVKRTHDMEQFITELKTSLSFKRKLPQIQEHCQKFLNSFVAVRGSYAAAAVALHEDWTEGIKTELGLDFNIEIDV